MPPPQRTARQVLPLDCQPCIWMSAGLLTYKLCDRAFDCERCPLDAALRGEARVRSSAEVAALRRCAPSLMPEERQYGTGHTWVKEGASGSVRLGIDAFAVQLLDGVRAVLGPKKGAVLERGQVLCVLETEIGNLMIRTPCPGEIVATNAALRRDPRLLLRAPYDEGWLAELAVPAGTGPPRETGLSPASEAREKGRLDLQRFRRQVAMHLLAPAAGVGASLADGGERLTTLPEMIGHERYLAIVQELLS